MTTEVYSDHASRFVMLLILLLLFLAGVRYAPSVAGILSERLNLGSASRKARTVSGCKGDTNDLDVLLTTWTLPEFSGEHTIEILAKPVGIGLDFHAMSTSVAHLADPTLFQQPFAWNRQRSQAAIELASGASKQEAADAVSVHRSTIYEWLLHPDFCAEVDRLSLMVGIASRAERLRLAMSVIRSRIKEEVLQSDRDALDWLKFAQSETDGVKIDLTKLAAIAETETPVADSRQGRLPPAPETEDAGTDSA